MVLLPNTPENWRENARTLAWICQFAYYQDGPAHLEFTKLGFTGFPQFQEKLRAELSAQLQNPISKHDRWSAEAPDTHILNRFATAAIDNLGGNRDHVVADLAEREIEGRAELVVRAGWKILQLPLRMVQ